jgi:hypothetical protein
MLVNVPVEDAGNDGMFPGAGFVGAGAALGIDGDLIYPIGATGIDG